MFRSTFNKNQTGAVILEFTLIAGVFLFTILAIMDLSRYFAAQALLTKGAQTGLAVAKTDPDFGIDIQRLSTECPPLPDGAADTTCQTNKKNAFRAARNRVITAATALPLSTIVSSPTGNGSIKLRAVDNLDNVLTASLGKDSNKSALVLRPGDKADLKAGTTYPAEEKFHPQICPPNSNPTSANDPCRKSVDLSMQSGLRKRIANEPMSTLFENYPVVVELTAEIEMFLPFFDTLTVTGTAVGYREVVNRSKVGQIPNQMACPITAADCSCGAEFEIVDGNCECQPKANICLPLAGQGRDKAVFHKNTCSCECDVDPAKKTNSDVPGSICADVKWGYALPDSMKNSPLPKGLWNEAECGCECNDALCPIGEVVTFPGGGTATISKPAGITGAGCFCGCTATSGRSGPNNNLNPCNGGFSFETNRCGCTCWAGEQGHCDRAMRQNPGKYVWNQSMCQCECAPGNPDPSCQPLSCFINNKVDQRPVAAACDAQGRKFDYTNCTCSTNCIDDASMAACPGGQTRQFDGTNCSCSCPTAPQSCNPGDFWNPTLCACKPCNISCGLQAKDPVTCTCISSGGS